MNARRAGGVLAGLLGTASAVGAALYLLVYLNRWEWQRALLCGVLLLIVEVPLVAAVLLGRVGRLRRELAENGSRVEEVLRRLEQGREAEGGGRHRFAWLDEPGGGRTFVFVPVLMATGAALAVVALCVQKVASATARPGAERRLAGRLARLAAPPGGVRGVRPAEPPPPPVPPARPRRTALLLAAGAVAAVAAFLLVDAVSDATQTRPSRPPSDSAASAVVFRVTVRNTDRGEAVDQAARALWEDCRRSTSALRDRAPLARLEPGVFTGVLRPALTAHDLRRLRGCLADTRADRTGAEVLGVAQVTHP
ncbi:hypothetical protein RM780_19045 [Streptomyces sp. DSM 44917]|uniref:Uncharacterized protein n=1 Tax=Streptomyces boetiae TaxID=3075541 RepID=A0ABU2LC40_9ACTN|nr:hypothetical protein [Streptomyces sp. DSM 44917]MDT0309041.1 hypothetical protein [Streptomyces sp. DSM 44917]